MLIFYLQSSHNIHISCMAYLIGGYFIYVTITFVIKGLIISAVLYPALIAVPYIRQQSFGIADKQ